MARHKDHVRRSGVVLFAFVACLLAVGVRAAYLQVASHDRLKGLADRQHQLGFRLKAWRGKILDRRGQAMAVSVAVPSVHAQPREISSPKKLAARLAPILSMDVQVLTKRLTGKRSFVWIKRHVTPKVAEQVRALGEKGISVTDESKRFYPNRAVGSHVVGFSNIDGKGLEGAESQFNDVLSGEAQIVAAYRDARGQHVLTSGLDDKPKTKGQDIQLTVDLRLQHDVERALAEAVKRHQARSAMAVVLTVEGAEILAMASTPGFNPNLPTHVTASARRNRVVTDVFEPGSAMKPLVIAAAIDRGVAGPSMRVFCEEGSMTIGRFTIRDSKPYGWLTLTEIIERSSNVGTAKVGMALGRTRLEAALRAYGFGARSGIELPGEVQGLLRPSKTWSEVGVANISFGHGVAVTTLQLASAYRVLASGGSYLTPTLLHAVDGDVAHLPSRTPKQILSALATGAVTEMMRAAVGPEGTGFRAAIPGYAVAGKTGTAQKVDDVVGGYSDDRFAAVFSGFLPANHPDVVIAVMVDEPQTEAHTGGQVAAPVFAEIAASVMRYRGVRPEAISPPEPVDPSIVTPLEEVARPVVIPAHQQPVAAGHVPSFVGLTAGESVRRFSASGLSMALELSGTGVVIKQQPEAGSVAAKSERLRLILAER